MILSLIYGAVAQLGERRVRNAKVEGSIPFRSTIHQGLDLASRPFFLGRNLNSHQALARPGEFLGPNTQGE